MADDRSLDDNLLEADDVFVTSSFSCKEKYESNEVFSSPTGHRSLRPRKSSDIMQQNDITKKIRSVVRQTHRSADDELFLEQHKSLVKLVETRKVAYCKNKERTKEIEDNPDVLCEKVKQLATILQSSKHAIIYTGAGISTSANIPDYRGPDGVWHQLNAGQVIKMEQNLTAVIPTFSHCAICLLVQNQLVKYVVSQNCDGLHVRSGLAPENLAEIHGNMYAEICNTCSKPYYRVFDVTERTGFRQHYTNRLCNICHGRLKDTIVHFGEHSDIKWPHNWNEAERNAENCDLILCLGSSLKVLRSYKKLWLTDRKKKERPLLCIVNLQWTPKDSQAHLKIHGKIDQVMRILMKHLNIDVPTYARDQDPLLDIAVPLPASQHDSFHSRCVFVPEKYESKFPEAVHHKSLPATMTTDVLCTGFRVLPKDAESSSRFKGVGQQCSRDGCQLTDPTGENYKTKNFEEDLTLWNNSASTTDDDVVSSTVTISSAPIKISDVPGWFGKGRRTLKKRGTKKRRKTN